MDNFRNRYILCFKINRNIPYEIFINTLKKSCKENLYETILLLFYIRDCRGGMGERKLFRWGLQWLAINYPIETAKYIQYIPEYGRWDDIYCVFPNNLNINRLDNYLSTVKDDTIQHIFNLQQKAIQFKIDTLKNDMKSMKNGESISLCCKWAVTEGNSLDSRFNIVENTCQRWNITKSEYRKIIGILRQYLNVTERNMSLKTYEKIDYFKVHGSCRYRLHNTFLKNDRKSFKKYLTQFYNSKKNTSTREILNMSLIDKKQSKKNVRYVQNIINEYTHDFNKDRILYYLDTSGNMYNNNVLDIGIHIANIIHNISTYVNNVRLLNNSPLYIGNDISKNVLNVLDSSKIFIDSFNLTSLLNSFDTDDIPNKIIIFSCKHINTYDSEWKRKIEAYDREIPNIIYIHYDNDFKTYLHKNLQIISTNSIEIIKSLLKGHVGINSIYNTIIDRPRYKILKNK